MKPLQSVLAGDRIGCPLGRIREQVNDGGVEAGNGEWGEGWVMDGRTDGNKEEGMERWRWASGCIGGGTGGRRWQEAWRERNERGSQKNKGAADDSELRALISQDRGSSTNSHTAAHSCL